MNGNIGISEETILKLNRGVLSCLLEEKTMKNIIWAPNFFYKNDRKK